MLKHYKVEKVGAGCSLKRASLNPQTGRKGEAHSQGVPRRAVRRFDLLACRLFEVADNVRTAGIFMATMPDRHYCGKCHLTFMIAAKK